MNAARILVVDDEPDICHLISDILSDEGYAVRSAGSLLAARAALLAQTPDLLLLDVWLPDGDGVGFLRERLAAGGLPCPTVMISGHGNIETAVEAVRLGAYDFLEKPVALAKLLLTVQRALEAARLTSENLGLKRQIAVPAPVGDSAASRHLRSQLDRAAQVDAPLLICGEAGTGKETLARYVHSQSQRAHAAFVRFALATTPAPRLPIALFGSDGASAVVGAIEQAADGTLYLDEIIGLPEAIQTRLAAALEAGVYQRDGGAVELPWRARLIVGSTQALESALQAGQLREDLFYQLKVLGVQAQPLRERGADIPLLLESQIAQLAARDALPVRSIAADALARLRAHPWPGNLRELRNLVQRLLILGGDGEIDLEEVNEALGIVAPGPGRQAGDFLLDLSLPLRDARDRFERAYLMRQLKQCRGSVSKLAALAGMERTHLYRKLKDLGVDPKSLDGD
ncbi:MAG: transcriptional regulator [Lysobacterales bacterium CG02_land_8_20_14_3_00_62_12]|nr:MAG: transcriptional regulator [Xanthomonadales bacterium CG02_land_8_20_14_3_00_62_12]